MKHRICDNCGTNITKEIEEYGAKGEFLLKNNIQHKDFDFCDEDCRKQYHDENCDEYYNESDQVSSTCLNCGWSEECPEL